MCSLYVADILITDPLTASFTHLEDIHSDKYLGFVLDNILSFNKHRDEIAIQKTTNLLIMQKEHATKTSKKQHRAYKTIIRPHLEYASPL